MESGSMESGSMESGSMESPTGRVELPDCITRVLWDTDTRRVTWETHRESVLGRVLVYGDWDAIRWLRAVAGDDAIRAWIVGTRGRRLSRQQIRFWQLVLDLPDGHVREWLSSPERSVWDARCV
jgi:hypothetical protein